MQFGLPLWLQILQAGCPRYPKTVIANCTRDPPKTGFESPGRKWRQRPICFRDGNAGLYAPCQGGGNPPASREQSRGTAGRSQSSGSGRALASLCTPNRVPPPIDCASVATSVGGGNREKSEFDILNNRRRDVRDHLDHNGPCPLGKRARIKALLARWS